MSKKEVTLSVVPAQPGADARPRRGAANAAASPLPVSSSSSSISDARCAACCRAQRFSSFAARASYVCLAAEPVAEAAPKKKRGFSPFKGFGKKKEA